MCAALCDLFILSIAQSSVSLSCQSSPSCLDSFERPFTSSDFHFLSDGKVDLCISTKSKWSVSKSPLNLFPVIHGGCRAPVRTCALWVIFFCCCWTTTIPERLIWPIDSELSGDVEMLNPHQIHVSVNDSRKLHKSLLRPNLLQYPLACFSPTHCCRYGESVGRRGRAGRVARGVGHAGWVPPAVHICADCAKRRAVWNMAVAVDVSWAVLCCWLQHQGKDTDF